MKQVLCENPWYQSSEFRRSYHGAQIVCVTGLAAAWELVEHFWLLRLPLPVQQLAHIAGVLSWLLVTAIVFYKMVLCYEASLEYSSTQFQKQIEAMREIEAERDVQLVRLSQELSLSLAEIISRDEIARQTTTDAHKIKDLTAAIDHAHRMYQISHKLIELKQQTVCAATLPQSAADPVKTPQPAAKPVTGKSITGTMKKIYARV